MKHDGGVFEPTPTEVVASWPKGSFAENLAVDTDGTIFVTLHTDKRIDRVDPATRSVTPFARFEQPVTGLAFLPDGNLIASGGSPGQAPGFVWRIDRSGAVTPIATIADAAFLNGVTPLGDQVLIADSLGGCIHSVDIKTHAVSRWLADPLLSSADPKEGPGANGIKLFKDSVTISVTGSDLLVRAPVKGGVAGRLSVLAENLRADDFAFDDDGAIYIATHPAQTLMRLAPDGKRTTLADAALGMIGSTAVAFGTTAHDRDCVYVTTTGGFWTLPDDQVEPAKLVRVKVGKPGYPPLRAAKELA